MNKNDISSYRTRRNILDVARKKFETQGFSSTSLQDIVGEIGLTRGAFYHHYKKKEDILFDLIEEIQNEISQYIEKRAMGVNDPWEQLIIGCVAFVERAIDKDVMKILLIDGPAAIPWQDWKKLDSQNSENHLKYQLKKLHTAGMIKDINLEHLTSFISGGLNELAVGISLNSLNETDDPGDIEDIVRSMLAGVKK